MRRSMFNFAASRCGEALEGGVADVVADSIVFWELIGLLFAVLALLLLLAWSS